MKLLTVISGIFLTLTGVYCIARQGTTFLAMAFPLGLAMLVHGLFSIISCITEKRRGFASGYVLADGVVSLLLSIVVLSNQLAAEATVPMFFGMWLLFSGVMHTLQSIVVKSFSEPYWGLGLGFGLLNAAAGLTCFIHFIAADIAVVLLLGIYFVIQGLSVIALGLHFKSRKK